MTKEQRLVLLKQIEEQIYVSSLESTLQDDLKSVAINSIIEEEIERLENKNNQESMLDKIRAEIDKARYIDKDTRICKNALASGLEVALQIIDKYKAESEDKE